MSLVEFVALLLLVVFFVKDLRFTQSNEGGCESTSMLGMSQGGDGDCGRLLATAIERLFWRRGVPRVLYLLPSILEWQR